MRSVPVTLLAMSLALAMSACVGESNEPSTTTEVCINGETRDCMCSAGTADTSRCIAGAWTACNCSVVGDLTMTPDAGGTDATDAADPDTTPVDTGVDTAADTAADTRDNEVPDVGIGTQDAFDAPDTTEPPRGVEGAYCYPENACDDGLVCVLDRCVRESDACTNDADREAVARNPSLADVSFSCGEACVFDGDQTVGCVVDCTLQNDSQQDTSTGCATCYAERLLCALDNGFGQSCVGPCLGAPDSPECTSCLIETGCFQRLHACTGLGGCGDGVCDTGENAETCPSDCSGGGACQNPTDQAAIAAVPSLDSTVALCVVDGCVGNSDVAACTVDCVRANPENPDSTDACIGCYATRYGCLVDNCLTECQADPSAMPCLACREDSGCESTFFDCSGESG